MPRYRENTPFMEVRMLCPGISQNTKLHHLTVYKGQIWREKPYPELCNHNGPVIIRYTPTANRRDYPLEQNGELYVPPVPSILFINNGDMVAWDSEILQSFAQLTDITNINFYPWKKRVENQISVGSLECESRFSRQCAPPTRYYPWYFWTKAGFKIKVKKIRFKHIILIISIF